MFGKTSFAECPHCGCNATTLVGTGKFGQLFARFECSNCEQTFSIGSNPAVKQELNGVIEHPVRCPKCRSTKVLVQNSRVVGNTRKKHRRCENCGQRFYTCLVLSDT